MNKKFGPGEKFYYLRKANLCLLMAILTFFIFKNAMTLGKVFPFFKLTILLITVYLCNRTLKRQYYTYWTFTVIFLALVSMDLIAAIWTMPLLGSVGLILTLGLIVNNYFIGSPVYYPQVNWWEYDFRFRNDLKGKILSTEGESIECRVADVRRNAASVHSFGDLEVNADLNLEILTGNTSKIFQTRVISKRKGIIGRPNLYGVHFNYENGKDFLELKKYFRQDIISKKTNKFKKV